MYEEERRKDGKGRDELKVKSSPLSQSMQGCQNQILLPSPEISFLVRGNEGDVGWRMGRNTYLLLFSPYTSLLTKFVMTERTR